jgi:hypothetical protein
VIKKLLLLLPFLIGAIEESRTVTTGGGGTTAAFRHYVELLQRPLVRANNCFFAELIQAPLNVLGIDTFEEQVDADPICCSDTYSLSIKL